MGNQVHRCSPPIPGRVRSKLPSNMYKVKNINEQGEVIWRGVIEVTGSDLVLHQRAGDPVRWPLKALRRYGFDKGLFSFESGRSCATGPGIYAFKCKNAEQLFNKVKSNTNSAGSEAPSTSSTPSTTQRRGNPSNPATNAPMPHNHTSSMSRLISTNGRIAGRIISSGATSPVSPTPNGGSSPRVQHNPSTRVEYINAADIRETGSPNHELPQRPSPTPPVRSNNVPSPDPTKKVALNYARLKLGRDEDDAVNVADGSLTIATADVDCPDCPSPVPSAEPIAINNSNKDTAELPVPSSPEGLKDENDNKMTSLATTPLTVSSRSFVLKKEAEPKSRRVKTGLLVEIGSGTERLAPGGSAEEHAVGEMTYMNLDHSPKHLRSSPGHVTRPDVAQRSPTSPLTYYTNLDTKDELPPRSAPASCGRNTGDEGQANKATLEFSFNTRGNQHLDVTDTDSRSDLADPSYGNVSSTPGAPPKAQVVGPSKRKLNYIQVAFEDGSVSSPPRRSLSSSSSGGTPPQTPNSPSMDPGDSPSKRSEVYAVIDTNKTVALANSQRQVNDGDVSTRRTRHDGPVQSR